MKLVLNWSNDVELKSASTNESCLMMERKNCYDLKHAEYPTTNVTALNQGRFSGI